MNTNFSELKSSSIRIDEKFVASQGPRLSPKLRYTFCPENVPDAMKQISRWVTWKAVAKKDKDRQILPGKFDKIPVASRVIRLADDTVVEPGRKVSHADPGVWLTFEQAVKAVRNPPPGVQIDGIGLSLPPDIVVIDLDNMLSADGAINPVHHEIIQTLQSYTELSPSGRGAHVFVRGKIPGKFNNRDAQIEMYSSLLDQKSEERSQFITVTGHVYKGFSQLNPEPQDTYLAELFTRFGGRTSPKAGTADGKHFGQPMPVYDPDDCRALEQLVADGVLTEDWATLIEKAEWDRDKYRKPNGTIDRSAALYGLAHLMASSGGTPAEFKWHCCDNRDNEIANCPHDRTNSESWFWRTCGDVVDWSMRDQVSKLFREIPETAPDGAQIKVDRSPAKLSPIVLSRSSVSDFLSQPIPPRPWLLRPLLLKGYVTIGLAPGGIGKTMISLAIAACLVTARDLIGVGAPAKAVNVLVLNNEDDEQELRRRFQAMLLKHGMGPHDLKGEIHFQSGYSAPFRIAKKQDDGGAAATRFAHEIVAYCLEHEIGAVFLDPLVSLHDADENDNGAIEGVAAIFRELCAKTQVALHIVAHTRKRQAGSSSESYAGDIEALRGASAFGGAIRCGYTVARMSTATATKYLIPLDVAESLLRIDIAKENFSPRLGDALAWVRLEEQYTFGAGDGIGVPVRFDIEPYTNAAAAGGIQAHAADVAKKRAVILSALNGANETSVPTILPALKTAWNVKQRQAQSALQDVVPVGEGNAVIVEAADSGSKFLLWRERRGNPYYVCSKPAKEGGSNDHD